MLHLRQSQSLQQKLSPQQIQYIKLLQLPTLALEQRIKAEMEINPLLEEGEDEVDTDERDDEASDERDDFKDEADEPKDDTRDDELDWDEYLNASDDLDGYKAPSMQQDEETREMPIESRTSATERLMEQLGLAGFSDTDRLVAEQIIGSVDEDGYLRRPLESITDDLLFNYGLNITEADVERVLGMVQRLDPVGIAARDLQECLLLQLDALPARTPGRAVALDMLRRAYKAFTMKHFDQIRQRLGVTAEELKDAFDLVQRLDPKPGEGAFQLTGNYVVPDFAVEVDGEGDFVITLNGRNTPPLRLSREYRHLIEAMAGEQRAGAEVRETGARETGVKPSHPAARIDGETRTFLRTKVEAARWFIQSIQQRRQTMLRVMTAIVALQERFFHEGEGQLRPMILKDIAERIGMDISTISRVVNGKYVQTEFGTYELKYFFSEGLATESGEEVSNKEVRAIIDRIIQAEDKARPLSDQTIAEMLEKRGFSIARRTVTKYREQLDIPGGPHAQGDRAGVKGKGDGVCWLLAKAGQPVRFAVGRGPWACGKPDWFENLSG